METIKDFLSEFKERLSSPLIGSFVIAWLIFNWEIPVILLFFKQDDLYRILQPSYIDAIRNQYDTLNCLLYPLCVSIFYTFGYPYIRNRIKSFQAARTQELDTELLKKSSEGYVSIAKHQLIEKDLKEKVKLLTEFYENQTEIKNQNDTLTALKAESDFKISEQMALITKLDSELKEMGKLEESRAILHSERKSAMEDIFSESYLMELINGFNIIATYQIISKDPGMLQLRDQTIVSGTLEDRRPLPTPGLYKISGVNLNYSEDCLSFCISADNMFFYSLFLRPKLVNGSYSFSGTLNGYDVSFIRTS